MKIHSRADKFKCLATPKLLEFIRSWSNPKCRITSNLPLFIYEIELIRREGTFIPNKFRFAPLDPQNSHENLCQVVDAQFQQTSCHCQARPTKPRKKIKNKSHVVTSRGQDLVKRYRWFRFYMSNSRYIFWRRPTAPNIMETDRQTDREGTNRRRTNEMRGLSRDRVGAVSYTHLTLPTTAEV